MKISIVSLLSLLAAAATTACGSVAPVSFDAPPDPDPTADAAAPVDLTTALGDRGFAVAPGSFEVLDLSSCCTSSCAGNNPSSPYAAFFVPPGPDETTPNPHARADGLSSAFRLRADEAIVFVGPTPPDVRYFGFTPYVDDRARAGGGRRIVAASLSETLNDLVIDVDASGGQTIYGRRTAIIATGDATTEQHARDALIAAGIPATAINTLVFDPALAHFGADDAADTFNVLFRAAVPDDAAALRAYLDHPGAQVVRITPKTPAAPDPSPSPSPRPKNDPTSELALTGDVDQLGAAIEAAYPGFTAQDVAVDDGVADPLACLAGTAVCAWDNRDTTYPATKVGVLFASDDDFYVVYGVDHATTGAVSYANVAVYAAQHEVGLAAVSSDRYPGTAQRYLPGAAGAKLYAYKIARSCGGEPDCLEIPKGACPTGLDNGALGAIAFRTYLDPLTFTAPSPSLLVRDRVLRFRKA